MSAAQTRQSRRRALLAAAALLATLTASALTGGSVAQAAPPPTVTADGNFCAFNASTGKTACVASEKDYDIAKAAALGTTTTSAAAASFLAGRFFDNASYDTAAGFIDYFTSSACNTASSSTPDFTWSDTTTWRGRISSFKGFSNCRIKAFENTLYSGASLGYTLQSPNLGVLNDHVYSAYFS